MEEYERRKHVMQQLREEEERLIKKKCEEPLLKEEDFCWIDQYMPYLKALFVVGGSFLLISSIANMIWG